MIKNEAINRGIDYIIQHLGDEISVDDVAKHCNYSKFHYSRAFKEETGESLYSFIKRLKVNQSAIRLQIENGKSIAYIGLDYGYSSTNYSPVFQKQHHITPSQFRKSTKGVYVKSPFYYDNTTSYGSFETFRSRIQIQVWDKFDVIYERHIGNYIELKDKWQEFIAKYSKYMVAGTKLVERAYDDPAITSLEQCIFDMCITVEDMAPPDNTTTIQGGQYAVCPYVGPVEGIYTDVQGMIHAWLPGSGYAIADRCVLTLYHKMDREKMYVEMDICIPVKGSKNS